MSAPQGPRGCSWVPEPDKRFTEPGGGPCGAVAVAVWAIENVPMPPNDGFAACRGHWKVAQAWLTDTYGSRNVRTVTWAG